MALKGDIAVGKIEGILLPQTYRALVMWADVRLCLHHTGGVS